MSASSANSKNVVPKHSLAGMQVGAQGFGCMGFSAFYSTAAAAGVSTENDANAFTILNAAVEAGVTLFNTADLYGPMTKEGHGANLKLLGRWLTQNKDKVARDKIQIMCKIGMDTSSGSMRHDTSPEFLRQQMDWVLSLLQTSYIDIAVLNRQHPTIPLEDSINCLVELKKAGKIRHIALSEYNATNIRRAAKITPIAAVEMEYSLLSRDIEESVLPTCRELGIAIVAYSPLSRGLLSGTVTSMPGDYRAHLPRFNADALPQNLKLVEALNDIAKVRGCTVGQLALAWVHAQGNDIFPIPGTTKLDNFKSNVVAAAIQLTAEELQRIAAACPHEQVKGERYAPAYKHMTFQGNKDQ